MTTCSQASRGLTRSAFLLAAAVLAGRAASQCSTPWVPGEASSAVGGRVQATTVWDPDGAGPLPPVLVIAGHFKIAGTVKGNRIAAYDPVAGTWSAFGGGMDAAVYALATMPNGDLVAGGAFTSADGVAASRVARWNGTSWQALGSGTNDDVLALTPLANGDLVAGGAFTTAGGVGARNIARWDGSTWSPLGPGMDARVHALTTTPNGDVVAGGEFGNAGGVVAHRIARWNGTTWSPLGVGLGQTSVGVFALLALANGDIVAGGLFNAGGFGGPPLTNVGRWSGGSWSPFGSGIGGVRALATLPNGDVVAGDNWGWVRSWNGSAWSLLGGASIYWVLDVYSLTRLPNGDLVAGGNITAQGYGCNIASWNGTNWSTLGRGFSGPVFASATMANGDLVVGGFFASVGGVGAHNVARWNGTSWSALGAGTNSTVSGLTVLPSGDLIAMGQFHLPYGGPYGGAPFIARWDGVSWSGLGPGSTFNHMPRTLVVLPNGDWIVGGMFTSVGAVAANHIVRWDGTTWSPLGAGTNGPVGSIVVLPNGDLVVGGMFTTAGGVAVNYIARWDGTGWSGIGGGVSGGVTFFPGVGAIAVLPDGDLVVGGDFTYAGSVPANFVARWTGSSWRALGAGMNHVVGPIAVLPNGDLIAGGSFTQAGGMAANHLARWNGATWAPVGSGTNHVVHMLKVEANGDVLVGGQFTAAGNDGGAYLARLTTTCPASAAPSGAGCSGSGGANVLTAASLPWVGSTFRSFATGMPASSLALVVRGFSPVATPLSAILPQGGAGCMLLASPDLLELGVPAAGSLQVQIAIPNTIALATQTFREQVVALQLGASSAITAATSTNALALTIGAF